MVQIELWYSLVQERTLLARQQEMDNVARQHGELSALLGQHRDTVRVFHHWVPWLFHWCDVEW